MFAGISQRLYHESLIICVIHAMKKIIVPRQLSFSRLRAQIWCRFERFFVKKAQEYLPVFRAFFHKKSFKDAPKMRCAIGKNLVAGVLGIFLTIAALASHAKA